MFPEITRDDVFRLETQRLWLRWPTMADASALAGIAGHKDTAEMTVQVPHPYPKGEASRQIEGWRDANATGDALVLAITGQGEDRDLFGLVELHPHDGGAKVGALLAPDRRGQGLATEAVQAMVDVAFILSRLSHVSASARVINPAARRVVERCGFAYEGTVLKAAPARGGMVPCDCFRLDRKAWASLKQWRLPVTPSALPARTSAQSAPPGCKPA